MSNIARRTWLRIALVILLRVVLFTLASYGLVRLIYGPLKISLLSWALIMVAAFMIAYTPMLFRVFRATMDKKRENGSNSG